MTDGRCQINYVKRDRHEKKRAKATIKYIQNRPGRDGEKITRALFGRDGAMERSDAYRMIDEARKSDILFRFVINPDPKGEDNNLNMREITENTMLKLKEIAGTTVFWTAAIHAEHTDKRHIHAIAVVPKRLNQAHFNSLIHEATRTCRQQRQELDLARDRKREREEAQWEL